MRLGANEDRSSQPDRIQLIRSLSSLTVIVYVGKRSVIVIYRKRSFMRGTELYTERNIRENSHGTSIDFVNLFPL